MGHGGGHHVTPAGVLHGHRQSPLPAEIASEPEPANAAEPRQLEHGAVHGVGGLRRAQRVEIGQALSSAHARTSTARTSFGFAFHQVRERVPGL
jgi:hypothetical protein